MKRGLFLFPLIILVSAGPIEASPGTDWLEANINPGGSWGAEWFSASKPTTELRDSTASLRALRQSGLSSGAVFQAGEWWLLTNWLVSDKIESVDNQARTVIALAGTGTDVSSEFAAIVAANNLLLGTALPGAPGGGWGTAKGHESNALDTALALQAVDAQGLGFGGQLIDVTIDPGGGKAYGFSVPSDATNIRVEFYAISQPVRVRLKEGSVPLLSDPYVDVFSPSVVIYPDQMPFTPGVNFVRFNVGAASTIRAVISWENPTFDTRVIAKGIDFLRACRNLDGGFGLHPGALSKLSVTMEVLTALGQFGVGYDTDAEEAAGGAYVAMFQDGTGAVGHQPGSPTAEETALAKIAFGAIGMATEELFARGALVSMQDPSGHWDADPYATATALQALTLVPEPRGPAALSAGVLLLALIGRARGARRNRAEAVGSSS